MLVFLFNMWRWILAFSAATGVITVIFALVRFIKSRGSAIGPGSYTLTLIVALTACTLVLMSLAVGMLFTEVPQICGGTVYEAYRELNAAGLTLALEKEIKLDENWSKEVIRQSIECHSVVRKGTQVVAYLKQDCSEGQDSSTVAQTESEPIVATTQETTFPQSTSAHDDMVTVPLVVGMEQLEGIRELTKYGLVYEVWAKEENIGEQYYIIDQSIPEGCSVPAGTKVLLELSSRKP